MGRYVERTWTCDQCGQKILGRFKECPNGCGSSREKSEMKSMTSQYDSKGRNLGATVTDPELLRLALAGADWFCSHCGSGNVGTGDTCSKCSAPRYGTKEENHPAPQFAHDHEGRAKKTEWEIAEEQAAAEEAAREARVTEQERAEKYSARRAKAREEAAERAEQKRQRDAEWEAEQDALRAKRDRQAAMQRGLLIAGGAFLVVAVIAFIGWAMQTHPTTGEVSTMTWSQTESVHVWTQVTKHDWRDKITERAERPPVNGSGERAGIDIGTCSNKKYETVTSASICGTTTKYRDIYRDEDYSCQKTRTIKDAAKCGESCVDQGNGFDYCEAKTCTEEYTGTCTRSVFDHKEPYEDPNTCDVYKDWCSYQTQTWEYASARSKTVSGSGTDTYWPNVELRPLERVVRSGQYKVTIRYTDKDKPDTYAHEPQTESDFRTWDYGDKVTLHINNLGGVSSMERGVN